MGNSQFNDITGTRTETVAVNSIAADPPWAYTFCQ